MDQKELHEKLGRPVSWAMTQNPDEEQSGNDVSASSTKGVDNHIPDGIESSQSEVPSNYQAMGESYSDTTNFEVNREPGRLD
ncbi:hypothetical protein [Paenibacillus hexagrammi]|uniref:Uncharacterized protein n=1 Tax=Paenibacillus hexagrammi TaxID=2908839 RepID=A0ABY3SLN0_9BACL|nr:hypothetical protein [Paenibacillus sp. YPD9-1]UJF33867.1 hypothetical protein L0M14_00965 [Paenibacillus sp. YPD9-1]